MMMYSSGGGLEGESQWWEEDETHEETEEESGPRSGLTWEDSLIFCSNSPPTRLYFSMHSAKDSAAFLDFSSA